MNVFDYIIVAVGVLAVIIGIIQLSTKKCVGILYIDIYTDESASKFALVSGIIYLIGGILTVVAPFIINYINTQNVGIELSQSISRWIFLIALLISLIAQFSVLKRKTK